MVEFKVGLSPGVIVGGVIVLLVLCIMLAATIVVVWRSRPTVIARQRQRQRKSLAVVDHERALPSKTPESPGMEKGNDDMSFDSPSPNDVDSSYPLSTVCALPRTSHSHGSTLNVIISPSVPHLVKLGADGAVELRVTPPSPVLIPGDRGVRFASLPGGMPGENESVWWFI